MTDNILTHTEMCIKNNMLTEEWADKLSPFLESADFSEITNFIKREKLMGKRITPETQRVFTAINKCSPDNVKVVMGLQDPYNSISADGIAMSCSLSDRLQPSLREVYREIRRTIKDYTMPQPLDLSYLSEQGVLLINASLTVRWLEPNSHKGVWDKFIDYLFYEVINKSPHSLVYIMLGKEAQKFAKYTRFGDKVLTATHPAAASYSNTTWDCKNVFTEANQHLISQGLSPIVW